MPPPPTSPSPSPPTVATGRLGRITIRAVVDNVVGTMLVAVECIDVASHELAVALSGALESSWPTGMDHANVFQYDSARIAAPSEGEDAWRVELQANKAIAKHLYSLVKEFGRLHASVVRHYMHAIVCGLEDLHRQGFACGGLSLSNLFLCERRVQIGAWFPPISVLQRLHHTHATMFTDNPFAISTLRRHGDASLLELQQRDIQSLAFLLVEMHTGKRVMLNHLTHESDKLLAPFASHSLERAFLLEVLEPTASLKTLATHPYLTGDRVVHSPTTSSVVSQCELIAMLIEKDLTQCRAVQKADAHQVRAWCGQFEMKFHRKPHSDERPASIQRLQQRCRAVHERIQELERRGNALGQLVESASEGIAVERGSLPVSTVSVSTLGIDTTTTSSSGFDLDELVDRRRRSPAQNAFLRQLSSSHNPHGSPVASDTVGLSRERGHDLLHQRKEVMGVIRGLEK